MMTGREFRAIRRFNSISQADITAKTRYNSDSTVKAIERGDKVPIFYVNILSEILGLDLSIEANVRKELDGIPEKYFIPKKSTRIYYSFPKVFVAPPMLR
jgi:transcriptional regulator with XRE-family HTH domain